MKSEQYSYVTVLSNKEYIPGVIALKNSLEDVKSKYPLTILIPKEIEDELIPLIKDLKCDVITRPNILVKNSDEHKNHYWDNTFFKISVVSLTEFNKIVLLDSDMLIAKNIDHLFQKPHMSAVVAGKSINTNWVDLNSGLMVIEPNMKDFNSLISCIDETIKRRTQQGLAVGDQDVFHTYLKDWKDNPELHLPEEYNCFFSILPILFKKKFFKKSEEIYVVHFIGKYKPWNYSFRYKLMLFLKNLKICNFKSLKFLKKYLRAIKLKTKE